MKILFVIHGLQTGGAEKVLVMLANYLARSGYKISIITFTNEEPFYKINPLVNIIKHNKNYTRSSKVLSIFTRINDLKKLFKENNPDIVISFITITNIYSILAAKLAGKKIIVSEHTNYNYSSKKLLGLLRTLIYPIANFVVVLTNYDKNKYMLNKNVHVIENPLIISHNYENIRRENIILGVGRLADMKGFDMLIKAFSKIKKDEWKLIILGEGPQRKELENLINQLHLNDKVSLLGITKDVEKYYKKANIFVLSSRREGFPGALCESIGYGCASIAFNCTTGPSEIIEHNINGILVEPENIDELSSAIQKLMENPKRRLILSSHSKDIISRLDIKIISSKWIELFKKVNK